MAGESSIKVRDRRTFVNPEDIDAAVEQADETALQDKPTYVEQLEQRTREAEEKLARYIRAYKDEVEGELQKRLGRLERESARELERMRGQVALDLLEVLDNFDRSLEAAQQGSSVDSLLQGLQLVRDQFFAALERLGVEAIAASGEPFDPKVHEATAMAPVSDPALDGKVVRVLKAGYRLGDRVIRPALVQVGRLTS